MYPLAAACHFGSLLGRRNYKSLKEYRKNQMNNERNKKVLMTLCFQIKWKNK